MKKKLIIVAIGALVVCGLLLSSAVLAFGGNNKDGFKVNGKHYNLNIIGVGNDNHGDVGDSSGHTMFVKLNGKTKIIMTQDPEGEFDVVDRNGLQGPAEFNIAPGHYNVYAVALGKPTNNPDVDINAYGNFSDIVEGVKLIHLGYVNINRTTGKPKSVNINELFYVEVTINTTGGLVHYKDVWVFDIPELLEYWWDYDNHGLKLLQVRFYECTIDPTKTAPDYCRWGDGGPIEPTKGDKLFVGS